MAIAPPPLGPARRAVREIGLALITLGVVVLLFVLYQLFGTGIAASQHQAALGRAFRAALPTTPPTTAPTVTPTTAAGSDAPAVALPSTPQATGGVIAHLTIPKIGLDRYVVDGTGEAALSEGPGHYSGTPYPGQVGDVAIAGHRTTYGAPFYRIGSLTVGDHIYLRTTSGTTFDYQVDQPSMVVAPDDVAVIGPTPDATLTLTTCNPPLSATSRLIVKARLVGEPVATPAPAPANPSATPSATPVAAARPTSLGNGDSSAWVPLAGWGALAVAAWVATRVVVARSRRWRRVAGAGLALAACGAALWFCFGEVVLLLPQSI